MPHLHVLEQEKQELPIDVLEGLRVGRQRHGKGLISQIAEIARLSFGKGKLSPEEYFCYRLYEDRRYSPAQKREFAGRGAQNRIFQLCCHLCWWGTAHDKLLFYASMQSLGFPVPRTVAVYHGSRTYGPVPVLRSREALRDFLRDGMPYPVFSKPIAGMWSVGAAAVTGYQKEADEVVLADGRHLPVDGYIDDLEAASGSGTLFQEFLHPHAAVGAICGDRLATVRIVVLIEDGRPEIFRTVWKVPAGDNMADNFWRPGNLLAAIDTDSGRIERVVRGVGPAQEELERHPDSAAPIKDVTLPHWPQIKEICLSAAATLPHLRLQAWDVAICEEGPVVLEVNVGGDFNLPQIATGRGLLDERFRRFLDTCRKTPAVERRWGRTRIAPLGGGFTF